MEPIIVFGTGRCGSSTVARILHEDLGIEMGIDFVPPDTVNPNGTYEDVIFWGINRSFATIGLSLANWLSYTEKHIKIREARNRPWGFKDNRIVTFFPLYFTFFDNLKFIWVKRDRELSLASMQRHWHWPRDIAGHFYDMKITAGERMLKQFDHLTIYFDKGPRKTDAEIKKEILTKWTNLND